MEEYLYRKEKEQETLFKKSDVSCNHGPNHTHNGIALKLLCVSLSLFLSLSLSLSLHFQFSLLYLKLISIFDSISHGFVHEEITKTYQPSKIQDGFV